MKERENAFAEGETVYAKVDPDVRLVVRRYIARIYYCTFQDDPDRQELTLYGRELVAKEVVES